MGGLCSSALPCLSFLVCKDGQRGSLLQELLSRGFCMPRPRPDSDTGLVRCWGFPDKSFALGEHQFQPSEQQGDMGRQGS